MSVAAFIFASPRTIRPPRSCARSVTSDTIRRSGGAPADALQPARVMSRATALPLLRHCRPEAVVAWCEGRSITARRFLHDVVTLAALLPARRHVVNLCADRYRFAVGLA